MNIYYYFIITDIRVLVLLYPICIPLIESTWERIQVRGYKILTLPAVNGYKSLKIQVRPDSL